MDHAPPTSDEVGESHDRSARALPQRIVSHLRSNTVAYVALFAALGGTSYAAVRLAPGSVTRAALANGAVTHTKLAPNSVGANNVAKRSLTAADFSPGSLLGALKGVAGHAGAAGAVGPTGAAGAAGPGGSAGPTGATGPAGAAGQDGNASIILRARGTGSVTAPHGASTSVPLSGATWTQGANDLNLVTGSMTIEVPASCTGSFGNAVILSVDGVPNTFVSAPTTPANTSITVPVVISDVTEPGTATQHTITAKLANSCTKSGEDYTVTNAKIDVLAFH
jgi:hypothetical protein